MFPCRHFGAVSGDEEDPVPTAMSWWEAPLARVPVSLRERGDTTARGRSAQVVDRSRQREHLLRRRRAEEREIAAARTELLATAAADGAISLPKMLGRSLLIAGSTTLKANVPRGTRGSNPSAPPA
ncbi:MAG: DUF2397 family protein [Pseudonocardiaceae bacterium]